jgi:hypothetical protein
MMSDLSWSKNAMGVGYKLPTHPFFQAQTKVDDNHQIMRWLARPKPIAFFEAKPTAKANH